ncbi:unnamed protein product, partial [marine sediment metagenome]
MSNIVHTKEKSRGSQELSSRSVVVETPQRETQGILAASFSIDNAQGEKKVSSREENEKDFALERIALLDNCKQLDIFKQKAHQERLSLISVFEQRGHFRQVDLLSECQTKWVYYECQGCGSVGRAKNRCGMRVCPYCAGRMKAKLLAKYQKGIDQLSDFYKSRLKLVTLTLKNVPDLQSPDLNVITEIKQAFYR